MKSNFSGLCILLFVVYPVHGFDVIWEIAGNLKWNYYMV